MLPILKSAANGVVNISDIVDKLANEIHISEEAIHESLENLNSTLANELISKIQKANPTFLKI